MPARPVDVITPADEPAGPQPVDLMHELSIAQSLIELLEQRLASEGPVRVSRVGIAVGELSAVVPDAMQTAWQVATRQTRFEGATLEIETIGVTVYCPHCNQSRPAADPPRLRCSVCGTPADRMLTGMELEVRHLEVLDPDE